MIGYLKILCASALALIAASTAASAATLAEIKTRGYIQVGTSGQGAPYTYVNEKNELVGYDIDWAEVVAKGLGVDVRWSKMPWPGLLPALQAGQVDMLMSAVKITEERQKAFDFSVPYGAEAAVAIVPSTNSTANSFDAIKGHVVAAVTASFQGDAAMRVGGYKQLLLFKNDPELYLALKTGQAEVAVTGTSSIGHYLSLGNKDIRIAGVDTVMAPQGIAFQKGSDDLRKAIDEIIVKGKADGTLARLYRKNIGIEPLLFNDRRFFNRAYPKVQKSGARYYLERRMDRTPC